MERRFPRIPGRLRAARSGLDPCGVARVRAALAAGALAGFALACAAPGGPAPGPALDAPRAELEAAVERDRETLRAWLSRPGDARDDEAHWSDGEELREIAARLPALEARLRALESAAAPTESAP